MPKVIRGERVGKLGTLAIGCSAAIFDSAKQRILLARRADNGRWALPGGYMESGESVVEACAREVWEETGLHVQVGQLIAVYSTPHMLLEYEDGRRYQLVVLHFLAEAVAEELRISNETTEIEYFSYTGIEWLETSEFDRQRITDAFARQPSAFIR